MKKLSRKILSFSLGAMMIFSATANAMTLFPPTKLGSVWLGAPGYFEIKGATYHVGEPYTDKKFIRAYNIDGQNKKGAKIYNKGLARFGEGDDAIYLHYDGRGGFPSYQSGISPISKYGGEDIRNTLDVGTGITDLRLMRTDSGITLYLFTNHDAGGFNGTTHIVLGKRKDGTFVQYFDTRKIKNEYFAQPREFWLADDVIVRGDTIVIPYKWLENPVPGGRDKNVGEFRFKWDDKAQWFGIEYLKY